MKINLLKISDKGDFKILPNEQLILEIAQATGANDVDNFDTPEIQVVFISL